MLRGIAARRQSLSSALSRPQTGVRQLRRGTLRVMAFKSEHAQLLLDVSRKYAQVVSDAEKVFAPDASKEVKDLVAGQDMLFQADGVILNKDQKKNVDDVLLGMRRQHTTYRHLMTATPVAEAVNEGTHSVFRAGHFAMQNIGEYEGNPATNSVSTGFYIEKLVFDHATERIVSSLVTRQMTEEERRHLLHEPSACRPAEIDLTSLKDLTVSADDSKQMSEAIRTWVEAWNSGSNLDALDGVMDPHVKYLDCYGLSSSGVGMAWEGLKEAKSAVASAQKKYDNTNTLVASAVCDNRKVGFQHWKSDAKDKNSGDKLPLEGMGLIIFNDDLKIQDVYEFTMTKYDNLKHTSAA